VDVSELQHANHMPEGSQAEEIRLVIWDMDETFWKGTLTEGGIEYIDAHHEIVIELARRGIMSSICSKNDMEPVKQILAEKGLWEYFIFPSINWEPKGQRVATIVDAIQLRPPTILFIDDNASNRNEVLHSVPGIQACDETIISQILSSPLLKGKDDSDLTRLKQYKLLSKRHEDEQAATVAGQTNFDFLRASNIKIRLEFDIRKHADRAVELINRTNQLNFTKNRLPEDPEAAREELFSLISRYDVQAGLVNVTDRYGDYGFVGFYAIKVVEGRTDLVHFCFSCRTLGMGIETWVYRHIGRPFLPMTGTVLSDPREEKLPLDWITFLSSIARENEHAPDSDSTKIKKFILRGGCNGLSIAHYFYAVSNSTKIEVATARDGGPIRLDHSLFLTTELNENNVEVLSALESIGYKRNDFETSLFDDDNSDAVIFLDFWTDSEVALYRHKELGFDIPFAAPYHFPVQSHQNVMDLPDDFTAPNYPSDHPVIEAISILRRDYEYRGLITDEHFKRNLTSIISRISKNAKIFLILAKESWLNPGNNLVYIYPAHQSLNEWTRDAVGAFRNVTLLDIRDFIHSESEAETVNHYDRLVYYRIYEEVMTLVEQNRPSVTAALPSESADQTTPELLERDDLFSVLRALNEKLRAWNSKHGHPFEGTFDGKPTSIRSDLMRSCQIFADRLDLLSALPKAKIMAEIGSYSGDLSAEIVLRAAPKEFHIFNWDFKALNDKNRKILDSHDNVFYHPGDWDHTFLEIEKDWFDIIYLNRSKDFNGVKRELTYCLERLGSDGLLIVNDFTSWDPIQGIPYGVMSAVSEFVNEHNLEVVYMSLHGRGFMNIAMRRTANQHLSA
jgi:FkbH-like protein